MRRLITVTCATAAIVVGNAVTATAAPPAQEVVPLDCDDGNTYAVIVNGNGQFTPGRVTDSTRVFVVTEFGEITFRAEPPGEEAIEMTDAPAAKGGGSVSAHNPRDTVTCTFELTDTLEEGDDDLPPGTVITISGSVTGFLTGRG